METVEIQSESAAVSNSISITWLLICTAIALFVVHHLYGLTYFWRHGIPGPLPLPLLGNMLAFKGGFLLALEKWRKKYGSYYGIYAGTMRLSLCDDVDIAKQVLIKDFSSFQSRSSDIYMKYLADSLISQNGPAWKRARGYVSPAFSGSKMKQMIPNLNSHCDALIEVLDKIHEKGDTYNAKEFFGAYVMDCVASCAFGIKADCQRNPNDPFLTNAKQFISPNLFSPARLVMFIAPSLLPYVSRLGVDIIPKKSTEFFIDIIKRAVELRKEEGGSSKRKDFLQLMIDAGETGGEEGHDDSKACQTPNGGAVKEKIPQTIDELLGQSLIFFLAGYDTVSTALSFVSYALATNPEVQIKLQEEIDEMVPSSGEPLEYDVISKMEYLDMVWCETLRMWPIAGILKRYCTKDFTYKGLTVPEKQNFYINVWAIHHDPQHWPDPHTFDPERFTKEAKETHHSCAYMPFGNGPRNCVGMRFAILEAKMAIIRMLQKFTLELLPDTPDLRELANLGKTLMIPEKGIHIRPVLRN